MSFLLELWPLLAFLGLVAVATLVLAWALGRGEARRLRQLSGGWTPPVEAHRRWTSPTEASDRRSWGDHN